MKRLFLIIFCFLTVCCPTWAESDQDKQPVDTVKVPFFNGVAVHVDLVSPVTHLISSDKGHYEAGLRVNLKDKFFPAAEMGWTIYNKPFFRVGCDYNVLRNKHDKYKLFFGLRYGFGKFDYSNPDTSPEKVRHWAEISMGTDVKITGPFHLGWDFRWRKGGFFVLYYLTMSF